MYVLMKEDGVGQVLESLTLKSQEHRTQGDRWNTSNKKDLLTSRDLLEQGWLFPRGADEGIRNIKRM